MSINQPTLHDKVEGKIEEIQGKYEAAQGDLAGDFGQSVDGRVKQDAGQSQQDLSRATDDLIGAAEQEGAVGVVDGQKHRFGGTLKEGAGKVEARLGHVFHKPDQEEKGLDKEASAGEEKVLGKLEEDASKGVFREAIKADAEYMKP